MSPATGKSAKARIKARYKIKLLLAISSWISGFILWSSFPLRDPNKQEIIEWWLDLAAGRTNNLRFNEGYKGFNLQDKDIDVLVGYFHLYFYFLLRLVQGFYYFNLSRSVYYKTLDSWAARGEREMESWMFRLHFLWFLNLKPAYVSVLARLWPSCGINMKRSQA